MEIVCPVQIFLAQFCFLDLIMWLNSLSAGKKFGGMIYLFLLLVSYPFHSGAPVLWYFS